MGLSISRIILALVLLLGCLQNKAFADNKYSLQVMQKLLALDGQRVRNSVSYPNEYSTIRFYGCAGGTFFYTAYGARDEYYEYVSFSNTYQWVKKVKYKFVMATASYDSVYIYYNYYYIRPVERFNEITILDANGVKIQPSTFFDCGVNNDSPPPECTPEDFTNPNDMVCEENHHGGEYILQDGSRREH